MGNPAMTTKRAEAFLRENGLHADCYEFEAEVARFAAQMEIGLHGDAASMLMAPAYLDVSAAARANGEVIAIDAGGTNLRIALVQFSEDGPPEIAYIEKYPVPGAKTAITNADFFDCLVAYAAPIIGRSDHIGLCFSFPCVILPDRDARILKYNKELRVGGAEGALISTSLNAALARAGKAPMQVTVLNDTAAALLGELTVLREGTFSGHVGLIYGTGLNLCYSERVERIAKVDPAILPAGTETMLVNTECGGYDGFARSACDLAVDAASANPGEHRFEKMTGGAYFGPVALEALRLAARKGLFGSETAENLLVLGSLSAAAVSGFMETVDAKTPGGGPLAGRCRTPGDKEMLYAVLDGLYNRSAKLLAVAATAVMRRSGGMCAQTPVILVAEGSSFQKGHRFHERFEGMLRWGGGSPRYRLILAEGRTLIGAAVACAK
jgi:hexokinase